MTKTNSNEVEFPENHPKSYVKKKAKPAVPYAKEKAASGDHKSYEKKTYQSGSSTHKGKKIPKVSKGGSGREPDIDKKDV